LKQGMGLGWVATAVVLVGLLQPLLLLFALIVIENACMSNVISRSSPTSIRINGLMCP
jgi:hypothetical protein